MPKCIICQKGPPSDPRAIHRLGPVGEVTNQWKHWECMSQADRQRIDPETKRLTDIIEGKEVSGE